MRIASLVLALLLTAIAQTGRTVDDLMTFIRSAIQAHETDKKIADEVLKIKLVNRLDDKTIEQVQHMGGGQKTIAALHKLAESSASLPAAAPPKAAPSAPPPPSANEQREILNGIQQNALNYTESLPNYICSQYTKRHVDDRLVDTVLEQLSYVDQHENYKVIMVNDRPVTNGLQHEQLGGAKSSGEFGSILKTIFDPATQTEFGWQGYGKLDSGPVYIFQFRVAQQRYSIHHEGSKRTIITGFHGLVYANRDTKQVMRVKLDCDDIPADFPIQSVSLELNYDKAEISGKEYVLPSSSDVRSREGRLVSWNEVSYHAYHKYSTDASISFDTPDTPPPPKKK